MLAKPSPCPPFNPSRRAVVAFASASPSTPGGSREPARPVALPCSTLWLLDAMQDQYYNVRGAAFVIPRVEEREIATESTRAHRRKYVRRKPLPARQPRPEPANTCHSLIHAAALHQPTALTFISDGPLVEVEVEAAEAPAPSLPSPLAPNTSVTGIVRVPSSANSDISDPPQEGGELFQTESSSPRRTKMLRFTCLADGCHAVNLKPISPDAFSAGTVFAQCGRCSKWHLIRDHLQLWDQSTWPTYRQGKAAGAASGGSQKRQPRSEGPQREGTGLGSELGSRLRLEDVPEGLRPAVTDVEWFNSEGRVSGWEASGPQ